MAVSRRSFLWSAAAGAAGVGLFGATRHAWSAEAQRNVVVIFASGGWDPSYALDPKDGSETDIPAGDLATYGDLDVWVNDDERPSVSAFFSAWAQDVAIIRGFDVRSIAHPECRRRVLTGAQAEDQPDLLAVIASELGQDCPLPYLDLGGLSVPGPFAAICGRVGAHNQLAALLSPERGLPAAPAHTGLTYPQFLPKGGESEAIEAFLTDRAATLQAGRAVLGRNRLEIDNFVASRERAIMLRDYRESFGLPGQEMTLQQQCRTAVTMLRDGVSRTVLCDTGSSWDSHDDVAEQGPLNEQLYAALGALMENLQADGLLDDTLVVVMSEMGRTPLVNADGGKDHWPITSMLVAGAGVRGGRAYGATDAGQTALPVDVASGELHADGVTLGYDHVVAGVLAAAGVDPEPFLPGVTPMGGFHDAA